MSSRSRACQAHHFLQVSTEGGASRGHRRSDGSLQEVANQNFRSNLGLDYNPSVDQLEHQDEPEQEPVNGKRRKTAAK